MKATFSCKFLTFSSFPLLSLFFVSLSLAITKELDDRFEAAWNGDGDKIKELTLAPWGPEGKNCPLQIAVPDTKGFSPFTLAVIRQHLDVADLILTIADAQHVRTDEESQRRQYSMEGFEEDSVSSEGEPVSEVDDLNISYRLVSEIFTINDITALPKSVASKVSGMSHFMCRFWKSN